MNNKTLPAKNLKPQKRTYFGISSLIVAVGSAFFLALFFAITAFDISPDTFNKWNNILGLIYCSVTPLALVLGLFGLIGKNDSKTLSGIAMSVTGLPFLVLFWQFINSLIQSN